MTDIREIEKSVLSLPASATFEQLLELEDRVRFAKELCAEVGGLVKDRLAEFIKEHGPQECGGNLWVYSEDKEEKPNLPPDQMADVAFELVGGDIKRFFGLLAANSFKPGATRKAAEESKALDVYKRMFRTEVKGRAAIDKPAKSVKKIPVNLIGK
jgi:formylmethanofuran:tetrahydromethanopterin formyltransferase